MGVAGSNYGLVVFLAERNYLSVKLAESLVVCDGALCDKKSVVAYRLYLKIIVEGYYLLYLLFGLVLKHGSEKLACLTCRADYKSLAVLYELGLWNTRLSAVVIEVA